MRDYLICGLADDDIKKKVLALDWKLCTLEKVLSFVEAEELGKRSMSDSRVLGDANVISTYRRNKYNSSEGSQKKKICWKCGGNFPHSGDCPKKDASCDFCKKTNHVRKFCKALKKDGTKDKKDSAGDQAELDQIVAEQLFTVLHRESGNNRTTAVLPVNKSRKGKLFGHHKYDRSMGKYVLNKSSINNQLQVAVTLDVKCLEDFWKKIGGDVPPAPGVGNDNATELAIGDTGASVCCSGLPLLRKLGASVKHLLPTSLELKAANGELLQVIGAVPVLIRAKSNNNKEARELL